MSTRSTIWASWSIMDFWLHVYRSPFWVRRWHVAVESDRSGKTFEWW